MLYGAMCYMAMAMLYYMAILYYAVYGHLLYYGHGYSVVWPMLHCGLCYADRGSGNPPVDDHTGAGTGREPGGA